MQKISTGFALSIITLLAVFFGGIFWLIERQDITQVPERVSSPLKTTETKDIDTSEKVIYENKEFGFSLELPANWKGYKTYVKKWDDDVTSIDIALPTIDIENTPETPGFALVLNLHVQSMKSWNEMTDLKDCKDHPGAYTMGCFSDSETLGKTNEYVIVALGPQWLPDDVIDLIPQSCTFVDDASAHPYVDCFRQGFKFNDTQSLVNTVDTSNWQTYRNEQYGFEFKYPNSRENKVEKVGDANATFSVNGVMITYYKSLDEVLSGSVIQRVTVFDLMQDPNLSEQKKANFQGNPSFSAIFTDDISGVKEREIYVQNMKGVYVISYSLSDGTLPSEEYDEIVHTIRFF